MKKNRIALLIGALLCAVGLAGWIYQLMNGLVVTNMRNPFSWGLYIASFELFIGLATGGMLLFSIAHLFHVDSLKPFARLGAWTSLGCAVASGFIILADLGQPARVLQMLLTPNVKSPSSGTWSSWGSSSSCASPPSWPRPGRAPGSSGSWRWRPCPTPWSSTRAPA